MPMTGAGAGLAALGLGPGDRLAVAVSGGGDSTALLHLLATVPDPPRLAAVTVNHGLRPAAADEAVQVGHLCATLGIPHTILHWQRPDTSGNLMDHARRARYRLMAGWAAGQGIAHVALGHTADDQAETFVMRLARRAGVDGLSPMAPRFHRDGITFHRPLLGITRAALRDHLTRHGIGWADDPTNDDPVYERARVRRALSHLAGLGIDADTLGAVARNMGHARDALRHATHTAARDTVHQSQGDLLFPAGATARHPQEIRRRIVQGALGWIAGAGYPERSVKLSGLLDAIDHGTPATLAGCLLIPQGDTLRLTREHGAVAGHITPTPALWDGRWHLDGPHSPGLHIAALGPAGLPLCPGWRGLGIPRAALLATPAVWRGDTLIAAPLAGHPRGWAARLAEHRDDFAAFLLSY